MKIKPIIVPINPPTYEKYVSTLLKLLVYVVTVGYFSKITSTYGLGPLFI